AQLLIELQAPPAIAQRNRHRPFGIGFAHDEGIKLGNDLARGKVGHRRPYLALVTGRCNGVAAPLIASNGNTSAMALEVKLSRCRVSQPAIMLVMPRLSLAPS